MRVSELIGAGVHDDQSERVGTVIDVRLHLAPVESEEGPTLAGLVISPHTKASYLGYERSEARSPRLVAAVQRWLHRGTFLALWDDVASVGTSVTLRPGYRRYAATLRSRDDDDDD